MAYWLTRRRVARLLRSCLWLAAGFAVLTSGLVLTLRWADPPTSAFVMRHNWLAERGGDWRPARLEWTDWSRIPAPLPLAVVASEDQRFPSHWGFDLEAISKALAEHQRGGRLRGASTISQQVAKNLFLWPGRSYVRKGLEAYFTGLIELFWSKRRILEVYLNVAQFGPNTFGVGQAAPTLFNRSPDALRPHQAALMAAVLPNPDRLSVRDPSPYVRERQGWILRQMHLLGGPAYLAGL
ncbi:monofunctional biosynthetic peptidoglycan transglycosylase [Ectothiorhodospiraceae bacterium WFHF3C12]|nr:monofunctional biosynthetic peptidoglycan transglycosylase [Ectothiorhodospiraceae bacterium WFHF3C12]